MPEVPLPTTFDELTTPRYTQGDVARLLGEPHATFQRWTRGYTTGTGRAMPPLVSGVASGAGYTVPFLALTEAYVIRSFLTAGVRMAHIRETVQALRETLGVEYALASQRLKTDGAVIVWELEKRANQDTPLVVVSNGQGVFRSVVQERLKTITYENDYAARLGIPVSDSVEIDIDPRRSFGQPTVGGTGVRVDDLLSRWRAGDSITTLAWDYDVPTDAVESVLRLAA